MRAGRSEGTEANVKTNEGAVDRVIRVIVGLGLLSLLAMGPVPGWGLVGLIGLIPAVTGLLGFCPTYTLLGIDTLGRSPGKAAPG
jgi:hypothetical protein